MNMTAKTWTILLHGMLLVGVHSYKGNTYSVQEASQEFSSSVPAAGEDRSDYSTLASNYMGHAGGNYGQYILMGYTRPLYHDGLPSIHAYRPTINGKDYNDYPHILPPGGKSIEQLQEEANQRLQKIFSESREHEKSVSEKVKKLKEAYGYGTIGYPGYKSAIKYAPIDLGTHNAIDLGATIAENHSGGLRLPVQTVTVTKTLGVRVPEPYPVPQEIPVPAPFPIPVPSHSHFSQEVKHYLDAFATDFSNKATFAKPEDVVGKVTSSQEDGTGYGTGYQVASGLYAGKVPPREAYTSQQGRK